MSDFGKEFKLETLAVHLGRNPDPATGAVTPAIHLSTTFEREIDGSYPRQYIYSRLENPNRQALEKAIATLERGRIGLAFSSGLAASMAIFQSLKAGDHMILPVDIYYGVAGLARELFSRWRLEVSFVDLTNLKGLENAWRPETRLVWVETPSNPILTITDISAVAEFAHARQAICVCDNTWATPILQRPLELGADAVVHSSTKYLGGHCDVLGGVVVARQEGEWADSLRQIQSLGGAVPSPFECWLLLRSLPTLPLRVRCQSESARQVAEFLSCHPHVESVNYPGLNSHPGHTLAVKQMAQMGGMLSFQVKGGQPEAMSIAGRFKVFIRATSLGGVESFAEHRASMEGPNTRTPANLLRISIGLENTQDLIEDLAQALAP